MRNHDLVSPRQSVADKSGRLAYRDATTFGSLVLRYNRFTRNVHDSVIVRVPPCYADNNVFKLNSYFFLRLTLLFLLLWELRKSGQTFPLRHVAF